MIQQPSAEDDEPTGIVVDIQHFSTHDGPGIRTAVFLKGCSLRCKWCCNPETISRLPELALNPKRCIGVKECGRCVPVCPEHALHAPASDGRIGVNWALCNHCGKCIDVCPAKALYYFGRVMSVSEVLAEVEQDGRFYSESGGGITLSGGECLLQPAFSAALLKAARGRGINTAIETAGNVTWPAMAEVLPHVDTMLHDYKLNDRAAHRRWVGTDNTRILANYRRAYTEFPDINFIARIPVISGINDDEAHMHAVLDAILPYPNVIELELLPYHDFGDRKYSFLAGYDQLEEFAPPSAEALQSLRGIVAVAFTARDGALKVSGIAT